MTKKRIEVVAGSTEANIISTLQGNKESLLRQKTTRDKTWDDAVKSVYDILAVRQSRPAIRALAAYLQERGYKLEY